ncbi:hypothetical protein CRUP_004373, partial [Coryphaenoides rupestris]
ALLSLVAALGLSPLCHLKRFSYPLPSSLFSPIPLPFSGGVTFAAKGYFDALVRMGEMASESQGSKDIVMWELRQPCERDVHAANARR